MHPHSKKDLMKRVKFHGKEFRIAYSHEQIMTAIRDIAKQIDRDYAEQCPLFLSILNGSFMFSAHLLEELNIDPEISFIKLASYEGTSSLKEVKKLIGLNEEIKGRSVIILEDIVDTGYTINQAVQLIKSMGPDEVKVASLLLKPDALIEPVQLDYVGMEIPNDFIVGFGLDYNRMGRNLKDIYSMINA